MTKLLIALAAAALIVALAFAGIQAKTKKLIQKPVPPDYTIRGFWQSGGMSLPSYLLPHCQKPHIVQGG